MKPTVSKADKLNPGDELVLPVRVKFLRQEGRRLLFVLEDITTSQQKDPGASTDLHYSTDTAGVILNADTTDPLTDALSDLIDQENLMDEHDAIERVREAQSEAREGC